jgi:hypothetical protein
MILTGHLAPTPTCSPTNSSGYFNLAINGNFSAFVDPTGHITTNQSAAQIFNITNGELFIVDSLQLFVDKQAVTGTPYAPFVSSNASMDSNPVTTTFCVVTQDIAPSKAKRQAVGLTVLHWNNDLFAAPSTSAGFCFFPAYSQIYVVFQSGGLGTDIFNVCQPVVLSAVYCKCPLLSHSFMDPKRET